VVDELTGHQRPYPVLAPFAAPAQKARPQSAHVKENLPLM
jgi:hypothetical protein